MKHKNKKKAAKDQSDNTWKVTNCSFNNRHLYFIRLCILSFYLRYSYFISSITPSK